MISVIMATHNGTGTLPLTLEAFAKVRFPDERVEFIAVDNASTDGTRDLLEQYRKALPLTVLSEPRKGKSFALNRAIAVAKGDLIIFADDDVLPDEQWLVAFCEGAARIPQADLFAGQVRHYWQKTPPRWLRRLAEEGRSYGGTPIDQPEGPVKAIFFKGANFMIRRKVVESVRFSERPGVNFVGTASSGGGEDCAFVQEALSRGHKAHYLPAACVRHVVRPHQVGVYPVLQRYFRIGRSMTLSDPEQFDPRGARILGYPRYLFRTVPRDVLRALRYLITGDSHAAADELIGVAMTCGRAQQWRKETGAVARGCR
ncbi:MAG: glycosyltransferase [Kiloniellaceae bacterium]|nr:glycosyltransferase [Kiloniellaceae bacterium]